jgi:hypothetical protein
MGIVPNNQPTAPLQGVAACYSRMKSTYRRESPFHKKVPLLSNFRGDSLFSGVAAS